MKVYKYRGIENDKLERDISAFQNNQFFAPKFEMLSDPFEANFNENISNTLDLVKNVFSVDSDKAKQQLQEIIELKHKLGILSLSKTCYSEQMWDYYASWNRGYCIEYDFHKLKDKTKNFDFSSELEITYTDDIPTLNIEDLKGNLMIKKMYGVKKKNYIHEEEIRLIFDNSSLKSHHESAITGIYFGYQTDDKIIQLFKEKFSNRDLKFYKIYPNKKTNNLESKIIFESKRQRKFQIKKYEFEILKHQDNSVVENYYICLKNYLTSDELREFVLAFREEYCYKPSNLNIFDTSDILDLIDVYPLKGERYVRYADSFIASADFNGSNEDLVLEYPLKGSYYKKVKAELEQK